MWKKEEIVYVCVCDLRDGQSFAFTSIHSFIIDDDMHIDPFIIIYFSIVTHSLFFALKDIMLIAVQYTLWCIEGCFLMPLKMFFIVKNQFTIRILIRISLYHNHAFTHPWQF